jgi:hypothetical protein
MILGSPHLAQMEMASMCSQEKLVQNYIFINHASRLFWIQRASIVVKSSYHHLLFLSASSSSSSSSLKEKHMNTDAATLESCSLQLMLPARSLSRALLTPGEGAFRLAVRARSTGRPPEEPTSSLFIDINQRCDSIHSPSILLGIHFQQQ